MNILATLRTKPWLEQQDETVTVAPETAMVGLRVFMAVISVLFFLFIIAYHMRMGLPDWRPLPDPWQLWINTTILLLSSVALQYASVAARRQHFQAMKSGLFLGGLFAFAFIAGQLYVWRILDVSGYWVTANPANSFFYLITGLHGAHLLGGLVAWSKSAIRACRIEDELQMPQCTQQLGLSIRLCAHYWHFLLATWLVLFGILLLT